MTRNVVPQTVEPRGLLRRRRTDAPDAHSLPLVAPLSAAPPVGSPPVTAPDELLRAKDALLQAALRQCDELSTETERLTAENELLRDALAALNAEALARQQVPEQMPPVPLSPVLEQRDPGSPTSARRRSVRRAGPA